MRLTVKELISALNDFIRDGSISPDDPVAFRVTSADASFNAETDEDIFLPARTVVRGNVDLGTGNGTRGLVISS